MFVPRQDGFYILTGAYATSLPHFMEKNLQE